MNATPLVKKTATRKTVYMNSRAKVCEYRTFGASSLRVIVLHWVDASSEHNGNLPAGTTTLRLVEGNSNRGTFVEHASQQIAGLLPELAGPTAEAMVAAHLVRSQFTK